MGSIRITPAVMAVFALCATAWGFVFLLQSKLLEYASPALVVMLRCTIGCGTLAVLVLVQASRDASFKHDTLSTIGVEARARGITDRFLGRALLMSLLFDIGGATITTTALEYGLPSGLAGVILSAEPPIALLFTHFLIRGDRASQLTVRVLVGVVISLTGIVIASIPSLVNRFGSEHPDIGGIHHSRAKGFGLVILAVFSYGLAPVANLFVLQRSSHSASSVTVGSKQSRANANLKTALVVSGKDAGGDSSAPDDATVGAGTGAGAVATGLTATATKRVRDPVTPPLLFAMVQYGFTAIILTVVIGVLQAAGVGPTGAAGKLGFAVLPHYDGRAVGLTLAHAIPCNVVPMVAYHWLAARIKSRVALTSFVTPGVALVAGAAFAQEWAGVAPGVILMQCAGAFMSLMGAMVTLMKANGGRQKRRGRKDKGTIVWPKVHLPTLHMKLVAGTMFMIATFVCHVLGLVRLVNRGNSTTDVNEAYTAMNTSFISPDGPRPELGVINGQGCGGDIRDEGAGCEPMNGDAPYFFYTNFLEMAYSIVDGGQLIFEWRGYNLYTLRVLLFWVLLLPFLMIGQRVLRRWSSDNRKFSTQKTWHRRARGTWRFLLKRPFFTRRLAAPSNAECIFLFWLFGYLSLCTAYLYEHARVNNLVGKVSRGAGGFGLGVLSLLIFPVTRHSVLLPMFGISFDRALRFHRLLAALLWISMTVHAILMGIAASDVYHRGLVNPYYTSDADPLFLKGVGRAAANAKGWGRLILWNVGYPHGPPLAGFAVWVLVTCMEAFAWFRRANYEWFLVAHMSYIGVFIFAFIHYPTLLLYCIPSIALYAVDLVLRVRLTRRSAVVKALCNDKAAGITQIVVVPPRHFLTPDVGSFITLRIPEVSANQEHPFSVGSAPDAKTGSFTVHIKDMGEGTWTGELAALARNAVADGRHVEKTLTCYIDGPFGEVKPPMGTHRHVFMVAGGVGVTPWIHALERIAYGRLPAPRVAGATGLAAGGAGGGGGDVESGAVDGSTVDFEHHLFTLIWSVREPSAMLPFRRNLYRILSGPFRHLIRLELYVTGKGKTVDWDHDDGFGSMDAPHPHWRPEDDVEDDDVRDSQLTVSIDDQGDDSDTDNERVSAGTSSSVHKQGSNQDTFSSRVEQDPNQQVRPDDLMLEVELDSNPKNMSITLQENDEDKDGEQGMTYQMGRNAGEGASGPVSVAKVNLEEIVQTGRRPDINKIISLETMNANLGDDAASDVLRVTPDNVCVYACGPPPLVLGCERLCFERGFVFAPETFDF